MEMDLRKYRVPLVLLLSIAIVTAAMISMQWLGNAPETSGKSLFPHGLPSRAGAISSLTVTQDGEQQFNTISVTGSGTASMQADEAIVTLGVQTEDASASEAVRLNAELMSNVIEALKALGLTEDDMKTVSYSVSPVYSKEGYNRVIGYMVVNMIVVEVTDMNLIGEVIDVAAENGANRIQGVSFGLSDGNREELKVQAYMAALEDAEEKAKLIAERLGLTLTGVLYVSESAYQPYQPYFDYRLAIEGGAPPTPIIEGKLSVSVTVHVIYSFQQ